MVFAAQKLRKLAELKSPTVLVLVDRTDLDTQISGTFNAADIPNIETTESIKELQKMLELDTRKIIISMIHKFKDAKPDLNLRDNIIVLVDEAHRTQEGDLGRQMRAALPNAFLFGLTGTPVNKVDKNTFWAFGSKEDKSGYLSRYSFDQSIRDNATLKLHFEPRLIDLHVDQKALDKAMEEFKESAALTDDEADALNKKSAKMSAFLKSPERVAKIVEDIAKHFKEKVQPHELKAMIVTPDREACVQYKEELDKYFKTEASRVVITTSANDDLEFKKKWGIDKSEQEKIVDEFNDKDSDLKFIIVTAKLLTGFDAPILQTMYLDKSLKEHTLIQAICRTNRPYPGKNFGCIVDYFGVFDDIAKSLNFDEKEVNSIISNLSELRDKLKPAIDEVLKHFEGIDRTIIGFEGLEQAQQKINTDEKKDAFAQDYKYLANIWESLSPDKILNLYNNDYKWLTNVYDSVRPSSDNTGKLLWFTFGAQTTSLIHENVHAGNIHKLEEFVLDGNVIRVLARYFGVNTFYDTKFGKNKFQDLANTNLPTKNSDIYNQAVMEFGALVCKPKNPDCYNCIFIDNCFAKNNSLINDLPKKSNKTKVKNIYLCFLIVNNRESVLFYKKKSGVWSGLYEFPSIEFLNNLSNNEILESDELASFFKNEKFHLNHISPTIIHKLSHQKIHAKFLHLDCKTINNFDYLKIDISKVNKLPVSRLIDKYLSKNSI